MSLCQVSPNLDFWSDASDVGWGAHLGHQVASGLWDFPQAFMSINARELLAIQHGLHHFQLSLRGHTVAVYCDNVTAVAYLRKEGGTRSPLLNTIAQEILRWSESLDIVWLHSSSRAPTTSWRTLCLALTSSLIPSGPST